MTEHSAETPLPLSAQDVTALRRAESVSIRLHEGASYILAGLDNSVGDLRIFSASQQRLFSDTHDVATGGRSRRIVCGASIVDYSDPGGGAWSHRDAPRANCFESLSANYNAVWTTVTSLLQPGDELCLAWTADNNTDTIREADLHADSLDLVVTRGKRQLTFSLSHRTGRDNAARMVRCHG